MINIESACAGYRTAAGDVVAVDGVSLRVNDNEILGVAGESGCGKSTLLRLMYGQVDSSMQLFSGSVAWRTGDGSESVGLEEVKRLWWDQITYVPQVVNILNPVQRIEHQILDSNPVRFDRSDSERTRRQLVEFFVHLGLDESVLKAYPHQLSGGMVQRVLVGLAAFMRPRMILADEPTTALDVVSQKRTLLLLHSIQREQRNSLVIVSHDLGVHYQITERLAVCYAGQVVELGPTRDLFDSPRHPYTRALIDSLPRIGDRAQRTGVPGRPPNLASPPGGCRFADRCPKATAMCRETMPEPRDIGGRSVACHHPEAG